MKILLLGGTRFLGRHLTEAALARGHEPTLFNRGRTAPHLFPELDCLRGDRRHDLSALKGRRWDAVIDTCGYWPHDMEAVVDLLREQVERYVYISSISVYEDFSRPGVTEDASLCRLPDGLAARDADMTHYGALKALCEELVRRDFGSRSLLARPGLIVGPHDPTDRFTCWPRRVARGGEVLAPGDPKAPLQVIDARDLANWLLLALERGLMGAFNLTGPARPLSMARFLETCRSSLSPKARFTWVSEGRLAKEGIRPFSDAMPLWTPPDQRGFAAVSIRRATDEGLTFRPLAETIRDTFDWDRGRSSDASPRLGLSEKRERQILESHRADLSC